MSENESDRGKVLEFMKQIKNNQVVEALIVRPRGLYRGGYILGKNER